MKLTSTLIKQLIREAIVNYTDDMYEGLSPEEKDQKKIEKFKAELDALGNPTRSELFFKKQSLYANLRQQKLSDDTKLIDYFYPKSTPEEKDQKKIEKFKAQLDALGNPTMLELRSKNIKLYYYLFNNKLSDGTQLIYHFYPEHEKKTVLPRKLSDQEKIEFYKAKLDAIGNPDKSELNNKYRAMYQLLTLHKLSDGTSLFNYFYPKKNLSDEEKIKKYKAQLDALGNPTRSELRNKNINLYNNLYNNTLSDGTQILDYFYPKSTPEEKDQKKIEKFKAQLDALGNPTRSELRSKNIKLYTNLNIQRLSDGTRILDYFYPKSGKSPISEVWKLMNIYTKIRK